MIATASRAVGSFELPDDLVLPFGTVKSRVSGRIVRLGRSVDTVLSGHDYPAAVSEALGQALALTSLLGNALKPGGRLILQTKSDGPLGFLVAHYDAPGKLRGYASVDRDRLAAAGGERLDQGRLLGKGRMAMTIDPGGEQVSHQGIVSLDGGTLTDAAHTYFRQSEQLPTFIRLAVARHFVGRDAQGAQQWRWRAGGLIVQHVPSAGGEPRPDETPEERDARLHGEADDDWVRVRLLASTVEDHELLDPMLAPERLLLRLFHEEGVRVSPTVAVKAECRCSHERIQRFLEGFSAAELADMREPDGGVTVTCEFCSTRYRFAPGEVG